jgi:hypothetical protein
MQAGPGKQVGPLHFSLAVREDVLRVRAVAPDLRRANADVSTAARMMSAFARAAPGPSHPGSSGAGRCRAAASDETR